MHTNLYPLPVERSWDLLLQSYADLSNEDEESADWIVSGGVSKWQSLGIMLSDTSYELEHYDYIWISDDDVKIHKSSDVDQIFGITKNFNLLISQPSLDSDSHATWNLTLTHQSWHLRYTNFVECMTPVFSRAALLILRPLIEKAFSGCGLDIVFYNALGMPGKAMAIIDDVRVCHTKKIDLINGDFYRHLASIGVDPEKEVMDFMTQFGMGVFSATTLGGVPKPQLISCPVFINKEL